MGVRSARCHSRAHDCSPHLIPSRCGTSACSATTTISISTAGAVFAFALGSAAASAIAVASSVIAFGPTAYAVTLIESAASVTIATLAATIATATVATIGVPSGSASPIVTATVCFYAGRRGRREQRQCGRWLRWKLSRRHPRAHRCFERRGSPTGSRVGLAALANTN